MAMAMDISAAGRDGAEAGAAAEGEGEGEGEEEESGALGAPSAALQAALTKLGVPMVDSSLLDGPPAAVRDAQVCICVCACVCVRVCVCVLYEAGGG